MKTILLYAVMLCFVAGLASGCAWWDRLWTTVPGGCEGMNRAPDSGNSPCPPGYPQKPGGNP